MRAKNNEQIMSPKGMRLSEMEANNNPEPKKIRYRDTEACSIPLDILFIHISMMFRTIEAADIKNGRPKKIFPYIDSSLSVKTAR